MKMITIIVILLAILLFGGYAYFSTLSSSEEAELCEIVGDKLIKINSRTSNYSETLLDRFRLECSNKTLLVVCNGPCEDENYTIEKVLE